MIFILKIIVGFTIGKFMSAIHQSGYLNLLPSLFFAIIGTLIACILIDNGFKEDDKE